MTASIQLFIAGRVLHETPVDLMDYDYDNCYTEEDKAEVFKETEEYREQQIIEMQSKMRILNFKHIIKARYEYRFILIFQSKINFQTLIENFTDGE